jgi:uncharacterized protein
MRRTDKEIADRAGIEDILRRGRVCNLGLVDNGLSYVVPVNYGYGDGCLYVHSAREGHKIDILRRNNLISFSIYIDESLVQSDVACNWGMRYRSVMGTGAAALVDGKEEKEQALRIIMKHYAEPVSAFQAARVDSVVIVKIQINSLTGKKSG